MRSTDEIEAYIKIRMCESTSSADTRLKTQLLLCFTELNILSKVKCIIWLVQNEWDEFDIFTIC